MAWPDKEHPWWSRYQLETILSATTFKQQASKLLRAHTEQLQKNMISALAQHGPACHHL